METITAPQTNNTTIAPQKEHQWLQQLVGKWTYETDVTAEEQHSDKATGIEIVRSLGDFWIIAEAEGGMPCQEGTATTMMTLGYDLQKQQFVGTWVGSIMTYIWPYEGELNVEQNVLTLNSEGPDMTIEGKTTKYRDIIQLQGSDLRVMTSYVLGDDDQWQEFMSVRYRRQR
ncbi:MAG: DUF1579 domain-containing protein [Phormidesmis sp. RL_2_1]|nr:DUF1579 domain-containing protein [Phormidesmis sp. RL_2_1]